jgi:two-component system sensor histidine kinase YesM
VKRKYPVHHKNNSIKKYMYVYIMIVVIPLIVIAVTVSQTSFRMISSQVEYSVGNILEQTSAFLDYRVNEIQNLSISVATGSTLQTALNRPLEDYDILQQIKDERELFRIFRSYENYFSLFRIRLFIEPGRLYSNEGIRIFPIDSVKDEYIGEYIKKIQDIPGQSLWTYPYKQKYVGDTERIIVSYIKAIHDIRGRNGFLGVLVIDLLLDDIEKILEMSKIHNDSIVLLSNADLLEASVYPQEKAIAEYIENLDTIRFNSKDKVVIENKVYYAFTNRLKSTNWLIVSLISSDSITQHGSRLNLYIWVLIFILIVVSVTSTIYLSNANSWRIEKKILQTELRALREQINPHFLYNTLDLMNWMAVKEKAFAISDLAKTLCTFYKKSLGNGEEFVTVANEIEHIRTYTEIQNIRFDNRITLRVHVPEDMFDLQIPRLTMQPIVENSIKHGLLEKEDHDGLITITGEMEGDMAYIYITDNGIGIPSDKLKNFDFDKKKEGYGLYNINMRLMLEYGDDCGIRIKSKSGEGTTVTIVLKKLKM